MRKRNTGSSKSKKRNNKGPARRELSGPGGARDLDRVKAEIAKRICALIAKRELNQGQAAELLGLDQPKVSALMRGRTEGYSIDRLIRCLNGLGQQVKITIAPTAKKIKGHKIIVT
jgi:predicted XRE-type DNA-binding protein